MLSDDSILNIAIGMAAHRLGISKDDFELIRFNPTKRNKWVKKHSKQIQEVVSELRKSGR